MADHSKPTTSSTYSNYTSEIDGRLDDLALGLDPANTTATNIPTNSIRWSSSANKWQKWSGTAWGDLSTGYAIPLAGPTTVVANSTSTALKITQTGTGNALVVEDEASDGSPFVIDALGRVTSGYTAYQSYYYASSFTPEFWTVGNSVNGKGYGAINYTGQAALLLARSNGATPADRGAVVSNNALGALYFLGDDGSNASLSRAAFIQALVDGTVAADSVPGRLVFATNNVGNTGPTAKMTLYSTGGLTVGTGTNYNRLTVDYTGTGSIPTGALIQSADDNLGLVARNTDNSATYSGIRLETRTTGASGWLIANEWKSSFLGDLVFRTRDGSASSSERMRIDNAGNLGLGVTPSAWGSGIAFEINGGSGLKGFGLSAGYAQGFNVGANFYYSSNFIYANNGAASRYQQDTSGIHRWYNAPSGTAGNAITFTQAMTLDASGNLGLGVTPSAWLGGGYMQVPGNGFLGNNAGYSGNSMLLGTNAYYDTGWKYKANNLLAAYFQVGNGTFAWYNAPSSGASGAGTTAAFTQAMTLDASGRLLVGTTTSVDTGYKLQVANGESNVQSFVNGAGTYTLTFTKSRSATIGTNTIVQTSDSVGAIQFRGADGTNYVLAAQISAAVDGTPGTNSMPGRLVFTTSDATSAKERMRLDSTGCLVLSANSNGIQFPATQVDNANANTLDDYEEGTWTPALSGTGSTFAYATNGQVGSYTKIGNQVTVQFRIQLATTGNTLGAGSLIITGLPFASGNVTNRNFQSGNAQFSNITTSLVQMPYAIGINVSTITLYKLTAAGTTTATTLVGTDLHATNGSVIGGVITYFV